MAVTNAEAFHRLLKRTVEAELSWVCQVHLPRTSTSALATALRGAVPSWRGPCHALA